MIHPGNAACSPISRLGLWDCAATKVALFQCLVLCLRTSSDESRCLDSRWLPDMTTSPGFLQARHDMGLVFFVGYMMEIVIFARYYNTYLL